MTSILLVRLTAIGDVIHALPAAAMLRRRVPSLRLGWVVEAGGALLLDGNPVVDEVFVWQRRAWRREGVRSLLRKSAAFMRAVADRRWDVTVDLQGLMRSGIIAWTSRAPARVGFAGPDSREGNRLWMTRRSHPPDGLRHVIERNLHLAAAAAKVDDIAAADTSAALRALCAPELAAALPLPPLEAVQRRVDAMLGEDARRLVLLNPGGAWKSKRWAPGRFGTLAARLAHDHDVRLALTIGPGEEPLVEATRAAMRETGADPAAIEVELPILSLLELAALCQRAAIFVGGDTGPLHLAAGLKVPCVALYGGSDPARNGPYQVASRVLDAQADRPGPRVHYRHDPVGLDPITVDAAAEACASLLA